MKAKFLRKAPDAKAHNDEILTHLYCEIEGKEVVVEKVVELKKKYFKDFCNDFLKRRLFITNNRELMRLKDGVVHCIRVTTKDSEFDVLVNSEGYNYARYTAIIKNQVEQAETMPRITIKSNDSQGNIYYIGGLAQKNLPVERGEEMWERVTKSNSYKDAIKIIREYVDLVDDDGVI